MVSGYGMFFTPQVESKTFNSHVRIHLKFFFLVKLNFVSQSNNGLSFLFVWMRGSGGGIGLFLARFQILNGTIYK